MNRVTFNAHLRIGQKQHEVQNVILILVNVLLRDLRVQLCEMRVHSLFYRDQRHFGYGLHNREFIVRDRRHRQLVALVPVTD